MRDMWLFVRRAQKNRPTPRPPFGILSAWMRSHHAEDEYVLERTGFFADIKKIAIVFVDEDRGMRQEGN